MSQATLSLNIDNTLKEMVGIYSEVLDSDFVEK